MRDKDELIKHGTIMLVATVLSGVLNVGFQMIMIRMLGVVNYATLFPLTALFMIVSVPAGTIQTVVAKYISSFNAQRQFAKMSYLIIRMLNKLSKLLFIFLILYFLSTKLIAGYLKIQNLSPVIIVGPILFFSILFPVILGAMQGLERFTQIGLIGVLGAIFRILFGTLLVYLGLGVSGALLGGLLSGVLMVVITWWLLKDIWRVRPYDKEIGKAGIYRYFIPVTIAYICYGVVTYIDAVIVKHYFQDVLAGYYSTVSMVGKVFLFPSMAFSGAMFPKVSSQYEQGKKTRQLLIKTLVYSTLVCLVGILGCLLFPKIIIYVLMRRADITEDTFRVMVPLLRFVGFAISPYGLACIVINYYLARHWTRFLPFLAVAALLQIVLLVLFHNTLIQVLTVLFVTGIFILLCGVPGRLLEPRRHSKKG